MPFKKFNQSDILHNIIKAHPRVSLAIYDSKIYKQNETQVSGAFVTSVPNAPPGFISLYEQNVDRTPSDTGMIYPFIVKNGTLSNFKTISTSKFNADFAYGAKITSSYPLTASISREYFQLGQSRPHVTALKNTLNYYKNVSQHYAYSSSLGDKATQRLNLASIPSIFFGSSIKKGSVDLKFYISGTLIGQLQDKRYNGELIQTGPSGSSGSGSVAGVVLYNEGFMVLTGSWPLETSVSRNYLNDITNQQTSSWLFFGVGAQDGIPSGVIPSSSYEMNFEGTQRIPTVTLLAHADKGEMNHSNNPTYIKYGQRLLPNSSSISFIESDREIKNTVESPYVSPTGSFEKITYISKIGIYDEDKNLIGIASVSRPVKKSEEQQYTFKLKMDF
tara:strand:+ start:11161 stop:12327 length:1167 start_codon:yes stop_codon:yes gene_type:complete